MGGAFLIPEGVERVGDSAGVQRPRHVGLQEFGVLALVGENMIEGPGQGRTGGGVVGRGPPVQQEVIEIQQAVGPLASRIPAKPLGDGCLMLLNIKAQPRTGGNLRGGTPEFLRVGLEERSIHRPSCLHWKTQPPPFGKVRAGDRSMGDRPHLPDFRARSLGSLQGLPGGAGGVGGGLSCWHWPIGKPRSSRCQAPALTDMPLAQTPAGEWADQTPAGRSTW